MNDERGIRDAERYAGLQDLAAMHRASADRLLDAPGPHSREYLKVVQHQTLVANAIDDALATDDPAHIAAFCGQLFASQDEAIARWREQMTDDERADFDRLADDAADESR